MTALIIVVVVAMVAAGGLFAVRAILGNRVSAYCQDVSHLADQLTAVNNQINQGYLQADFSQVSAALGSAVQSLNKLRNENPPADAIDPLDSMIGFLNQLKGYADTNDVIQYFLFVVQKYQTDFITPGSLLQQASLQYCQ